MGLWTSLLVALFDFYCFTCFISPLQVVVWRVWAWCLTLHLYLFRVSDGGGWTISLLSMYAIALPQPSPNTHTTSSMSPSLWLQLLTYKAGIEGRNMALGEWKKNPHIMTLSQTSLSLHQNSSPSSSCLPLVASPSNLKSTLPDEQCCLPAMAAHQRAHGIPISKA